MTGAEEAQDEVVAFLASPAAHGGEARIERIDTHISRIFLAGERALKLKRAVRFPEGAPILDFTTVEARRAACEAEVAVNRRTAPALYLGTAPVLRDAAGALRLGRPGAAVEDARDWVVVMCRFDQEALLDAMARRGALDAAVLDDLADAVARFHEDAERTPDYGGAGAMGAVVSGTTGDLRRFAPAILEAAAVDALAAALDEALAANGALLDARRAAGFVRHCHGDLHLRNICLLDGKPTPFDAIEFNPAIANIDVLYDLAFLLMDLAHRGMEAAANAVLNRYLAHEGDYGGLAALPLFLALRAAIRAQIAATRAEEGGDGEAAEEARAYLALAQRFLALAPPVLVAVGGLSGSGKSLIARALAPALGRAPGAVVLRSDVIRKRLMGAAPEARLGADAYADEVTGRVYREIAERAGAVLASGFSAVADAVHARAAERRAIEDVAAAHGAPFHGLWLDAPEAVRIERVSGRGRDASDADAGIARRQSSFALGDIGWSRIDASAPPDDVAASCRRALNLKEKDRRL